MRDDMEHAHKHAWKLTGPSYEWGGDVTAGRIKKPLVQKYESARCVEDFLRDPRVSLEFDGDDQLQRAKRNADDSYQFEARGLRKLFQPAHRRFYLLVVELRCDAPGFPPASREAVCEAGFVIRRNGSLSNGARTPSTPARWRRKLVDGSALPYGNVGSWVPCPGDEETPDGVLDELFIPLHPLVADPREKGHPAKGRSLYFGMVPTANSETTLTGAPALDHQSSYEIRTFVRRHDPVCKKKPGGKDCRGALVWSEPTEVFCLASFYDATGTSFCPVTIAMPDVNDMRAAAGRVRPSVKFDVPPGSAMRVNKDDPGASSVGASEICSVSIPMITFVAMFVFQLFQLILSIPLAFLLGLKFCIGSLPLPQPPNLSFPTPPDPSLTPPSGNLTVRGGT